MLTLRVLIMLLTVLAMVIALASWADPNRYPQAIPVAVFLTAIALLLSLV